MWRGLRYSLLVFVVAAVAWGFSSLQQRQAYLQLLGIDEVPAPLADWRLKLDFAPWLGGDARVPQTTAPAAPAPDSNRVPRVVKLSDKITPHESAAKKDESRYRHVPDLSWLACGKSPTRAVTDVDVPNIYQWRDEKGQMHFADKAQHKSATFIGNKFAAARQLFRLEVQFVGMDRNGALEDQLRQAATQAFEAVILHIADEHLRQINLRIKLFASRLTYEQERNRLFPGNNAFAFYTQQDNTIYLVNDSNRSRLTDVARHETTHAIVAGITGPMPVWLNEGLAEAVETGFTLPSDIPADLTLQEIRRVLSLQGPLFYSANTEQNYQTAAKLVIYLRSDPRGRTLLAQIFDTLAQSPCQPIDSEALLNEHFGSLNNIANAL
ncbi:MAG: hypothetical protein H6999_10535 [Hahellaceae bacterium]|nr:hypothetical protein [Hahellaceae bacterium]